MKKYTTKTKDSSIRIMRKLRNKDIETINSCRQQIPSLEFSQHTDSQRLFQFYTGLAYVKFCTLLTFWNHQIHQFQGSQVGKGTLLEKYGRPVSDIVPIVA